MPGVLVLAEHRGGALRAITLEMLSAARRIGGPTSVLLIGAEGLAEDLRSRADRVLVVPGTTAYDLEPWLEALGAVIAAVEPELVLIGHTAEGMDLAPAFAAASGLPLVTDCAGLTMQDGALGARRHRYGGKVQEDLVLKPAPTVVATVRAAAFEPANPGGDCVIEVLGPLGPPRTRRFVRHIEAELEDVDIAAAEVLVSVGRGLGKPENLAPVRELAELLGATLSCSRPVADKGWLPKSRQVGTSGKVVRPRLYLALGISGAFQHLAGMRQADTIIAVNSDAAAPIFDVAHYGIVDDMFRVLPVLRDKLAR